MDNLLILQKRLKKATSFLNIGLYAPAVITLVCLLDILMPKAVIMGEVPALVALQLSLFALTGVWRWIAPEKDARAGRLCFYINIGFLILWAPAVIGFMLNMHAWTGPLFLFLYLFELLSLTHTNRLISALYNPKHPQAEDMASPCPTMFHILAVQKTLVYMPLLMALLFGTVVKLAGGWAWVGALVGFVPGLLSVILMVLPCYLMKRTEAPSFFQRIIRHIALQILLSRKTFPDTEVVAFKWWLSHPNQQWPAYFEELAKHIETASFDWQNPQEWEQPLSQAAQQAGPFLGEKLSPLIIGEYATGRTAEEEER